MRKRGRGNLVNALNKGIRKVEIAVKWDPSPAGQPPTDFVMTSLSNRAATFENRAHDFPKVIRYALRADGVLEATVSDGAEKKVTYTFRARQASP